MTSAAATLLLARTHLRMFGTRMKEALGSNRLLMLTMLGFLGLYCVAAYILVGRGLDFIQKMPLFGPILMERLVHLLFFFFFVMLIISNATITGMGLFRRKDMDWQVALPLPSRSLVVWKTVEGMILASWGLLVLSAPILLALGRMYQMGPSFYLAGVPALLCLVTLSANLSTWVLLLLVRHARRWWWKLAGTLGGGVLVLALYRFFSVDPDSVQTRDLVANLHEVLKHTELCMHPLLPSSWVAETIFAAGKGLTGKVWFFNLALLANALLALLITAWLGNTLFYPAWNRVMTAVPGGLGKGKARIETMRPTGHWLRFLGLDRASAALIVKDVRTFLREPTQWGQTALIFGLLLIYTTNLWRLGYDLQSPFWMMMISHLNLLVCSLSLSTLTTRFIFPQFSMEGQRLWIVGLSPLSLARVLSLKLWLSASAIGLLTTGLVLTSSLSLKLPWQKTVQFCVAILLMSYGLTALALALGGLIPNFREPNPARIISGFGGTLCLISSFLYILGCSTAMALPAALGWHASKMGQSVAANVQMMRELAALGGVFLLTLLFGSIPFWIAKKRTKSLDYLKEL